MLLGDLARALGACEEAGLAPVMRHGIIMTAAGYVLPLHGGWAARMLNDYGDGPLPAEWDD